METVTTETIANMAHQAGYEQVLGVQFKGWINKHFVFSIIIPDYVTADQHRKRWEYFPEVDVLYYGGHQSAQYYVVIRMSP
jgi:hypothetical protein